MRSSEAISETSERVELLELLGKEFPNPDFEMPGIYANDRLVDTLGPELVLDYLGTFIEEVEADPQMFRIALSELSDVVIYSIGQQDSNGVWRLLDTREHMGWKERGEILLEMSTGERQRYERLYGGLVQHNYWSSEQEWLEQSPYQDLLPYPDLQKLRLDLPEL
ncbi:MAG: hypothetical protein A2785_01735 [Candidatus Chisholmbacteria bacterium RIFCSPHIGHO2_01_FULL_49_18]|uniref:Uncharacterized protein n=2 Tax=Candidatus Chisholmiibacteriota TaxID=1817900 RepID=A0A1G1VLN1_9BACT|nr:MAG: hypothetical protein A2785_01735 [Candidatus Chisholmbacteria bacterium RIFCSPHIGHO2_01_FULL_49_18]OGY21733.1 MAG: hypothetical protein A3A65_02080 [Candidatus Chisholmbacteria bacterium RIFCSPLOWO2_01_FULL_49_14]